jgi:hypothetical protein
MYYTALKVITPPSVSVVPIELIAQHLRLDGTAEYNLVAGYAQVATEMAESYLNRALITQTLQYTVSDHVLIPDMYLVVLPLALTQIYASPRQYCELPRAPVQAILSVNFNGIDGSVTNTTDFTTNLSAEPATVIINYTPSLGLNISNIQLTYVAGYGLTPDAVPISIKHAILMLTAFLYEKRGDSPDGDMPRAITRLLSNYRLQSFA